MRWHPFVPCYKALLSTTPETSSGCCDCLRSSCLRCQVRYMDDAARSTAMMLKPTARPTPTADPTSISSVVTPLYDLAQTVIFLRHSDLEHSSVKLLNVARRTRGISGGGGGINGGSFFPQHVPQLQLSALTSSQLSKLSSAPQEAPRPPHVVSHPPAGGPELNSVGAIRHTRLTAERSRTSAENGRQTDSSQ